MADSLWHNQVSMRLYFLTFIFIFQLTIPHWMLMPWIPSSLPEVSKFGLMLRKRGRLVSWLARTIVRLEKRQAKSRLQKHVATTFFLWPSALSYSCMHERASVVNAPEARLKRESLVWTPKWPPGIGGLLIELWHWLQVVVWFGPRGGICTQFQEESSNYGSFNIKPVWCVTTTVFQTKTLRNKGWCLPQTVDNFGLIFIRRTLYIVGL